MKGQVGCFSCGKTDHVAKFCEAKDRCHNCGAKGHRATACPNPQKCRRCAHVGHRESDCTANLLIACHNCGKFGHIVKDCPEEQLCRNCQRPGHKATDCKGEAACRRCRQPGHQVKDCQARRNEVCQFYASGACKKGDTCDYEHIGPPGHSGLGFLASSLPVGDERRRAPDGKRHTKLEFKELYNGYQEWDAAEERLSLRNGKVYTKSQFKEHFGDYREWDIAVPVHSPYPQHLGMKGKGGKSGPFVHAALSHPYARSAKGIGKGYTYEYQNAGNRGARGAAAVPTYQY